MSAAGTLPFAKALVDQALLVRPRGTLSPQPRTHQRTVEDPQHLQSTLWGCPSAELAVPCALRDGGVCFPGGLVKNKHRLIQQQIN